MIPREKDALYRYKLDWNTIKGSKSLQNIIKTWIGGKIEEYLGEREDTLCDFIMSKILAESSPTQLESEVEVVLDTDAENFVIQLYQLLIKESLKIA